MKTELIIDECKKHDWEIVKDLYSLKKVKPSHDWRGRETLIALNYLLPVILVVCSKCGEVRLFSEKMVRE